MSKKMDITKLAERLAQINASNNRQGGSMRFLSIKDGRNVFRILPPHANSEMFYEEVWLHYGVGKTEENKKGHVVICPTTHGDSKACPVCELAKELRSLSKKKGDNYQKQASSIGRKKRVYYNAIDRADDLATYHKNDEDKWVNAEGEEENPVGILATGVTVFKDLLNIIVDPEYGDITDADEGLDVILTKSGTGMGTEYDTKTVRKESVIGFDLWEECLNDLHSLTNVKTYDEISAIMQGEDPKESDDEEDVKDKDKDTKEIEKATKNKESTKKPDSKVDKKAEEESHVEDDDDADEDELEDEIKKALERRKNK